MRPEVSQHMDILGVRHPAFDNADIAVAYYLDIGNRAAIKFDQVNQIKQPFIQIKQRHMAAKTAG